jgi:hypothetical protein
VGESLDLRLSRGETAVHDFEKTVNPKTRIVPAESNSYGGRPTNARRHFVKIGGVPSYWVSLRYSQTTASAGSATPPPTPPAPPPQVLTLASLKHGLVIQITVQGVADLERVAQQAMGDALRRV